MKIVHACLVACLVAMLPFAAQAALASATAAAGGPPASAPATTAASAPASAPALHAYVDPRVELLSVVFRLAGNPEYNNPASKSRYSQEVLEYFGPFKDHSAVQMAKRLRSKHGVAYDAVMCFAIHLQDTRGFEFAGPIDSPERLLDSRWSVQDARSFAKQLRSFAEAGKFNDFFRDHAGLYVKAGAALDGAIGDTNLRAWYDGYFGSKVSPDFRLVIGMLNGGGNYGARVAGPNGTLIVYSIIGAHQFNADGSPRFHESVGSTMIHEFCHSYANPLVDAHLKELLPAGQRLFKTCADQMRQQAYGSPDTLLRESLVRACTVRYIHNTQGRMAAWAAGQKDVRRGFVWVPALSTLLGLYEGNRDRYPTLEAFMPRVIEFFNAYVAGPDKPPATRAGPR